MLYIPLLSSFLYLILMYAIPLGQNFRAVSMAIWKSKIYSHVVHQKGAQLVYGAVETCARYRYRYILSSHRTLQEQLRRMDTLKKFDQSVSLSMFCPCPCPCQCPCPYLILINSLTALRIFISYKKTILMIFKASTSWRWNLKGPSHERG